MILTKIEMLNITSIYLFVFGFTWGCCFADLFYTSIILFLYLSMYLYSKHCQKIAKKNMKFFNEKLVKEGKLEEIKKFFGDCDIFTYRYLVNQLNSVGTPLNIACKYGHLEIVKYFIVEQLVDPHIENELPLLYAAKWGQTEVIKYLIENYDCKVSAKNSRALLAAAHHNHIKAVELLKNYRYFQEEQSDIDFAKAYSFKEYGKAQEIGLQKLVTNFPEQHKKLLQKTLIRKRN